MRNKKTILLSCLLALVGVFSMNLGAFAEVSDDIPLSCLDRLIHYSRDEIKEVALADCLERGGKVGFERGFHIWWRPHEKNLYGYLQAKKIREMPDGATLYLLVDNGGGTGIFYSLMGVRREGNLLQKTLEIRGGDRCSGGIERVQVLEGQRILVARNITTYRFLRELEAHLASEDSRDNSFVIFGREDWPYCAICCMGHAESIYDFSGNFSEKGDLSINLKSLRDEAKRHQATKCLLAALLEATDAALDIDSGKDFLSLSQKEIEIAAPKIKTSLLSKC